MEWGVASGMGKVPSHYASSGMTSLGDGLDIKELPREVLDTRKHHQRDLWVAFNCRDNVFGAECLFSHSRCNTNQVCLGVKIMMFQMGGGGVLITPKGMVLNHDLETIFRWFEEGAHHHVQIRRQGVHHDHFGTLGADEFGGRTPNVLGRKHIVG